MIKLVMTKAAYALMLLVMGASMANAASLAVSPLRATLSASQKVEAITVRKTLQNEILYTIAEGEILDTGAHTVKRRKYGRNWGLDVRSKE